MKLDKKVEVLLKLSEKARYNKRICIDQMFEGVHLRIQRSIDENNYLLRMDLNDLEFNHRLCYESRLLKDALEVYRPEATPTDK